MKFGQTLLSNRHLAHTKGLKAMKDAEERALMKVENFKLITFAPTKSQKTKNRSINRLYQDESEVTRALCFLQRAGEALRNEAFTHEWTCYPSSLFEPNSVADEQYIMRTGTKSDFLLPLLTVRCFSATQSARFRSINCLHC
jgi:hypothetical protein